MTKKAEYSDQELADKIKTGQIKAFDQLFERYSQSLYRFARSLLKTHEDAEEVVQEVFYKVWNARKEISLRKSFRSFLFTIAYNVIIDQLRKRVKDQKYEQFLIYQAQRNFLRIEADLEYEDLKKQVEKAIHELPEKRKQIFQMSREEGLSHKEIADRNHIKIKTVENHINLALRHIRKRVGTNDIGIILSSFLFVYL
jgi:RNA polymerase sigma-70 factor (ECF subfamily)